MEEEQKNKNKENYISLFEAAKLCSYSEPYLRLRARQGKLKSIKLGKKWMTTAVWLADYEKRVQIWKSAAEAKRVVPTAVLVSAPAELSRNLAETAAVGHNVNNTASGAEMPEVTVYPAAPAWEADDMPLLPSKAPLARFATGQILPVPKQSETEIDSGNHFAWFGALVSGVLTALILAVAVSSGGAGNLAASAGKFAQANASVAAIGDEGNTAAISDPVADVAIFCRNTAEDVKDQFSSDRLKELVKETARFLDSLDMSGW
jgi:hypothetical protein